MPLLGWLVAGCERQQRDVAGLLDSACKTTLVLSADTSQTAGHNLATLGNKALQQADIAIVDGIDLLYTELADLFTTEKLASAWTAGTAACGAWAARAAAFTWAGRTFAGCIRAGACVVWMLLPAQMPVLPVCWFRQPFVPSFSLSLESDCRAVLIGVSMPAFDLKTSTKN